MLNRIFRRKPIGLIMDESGRRDGLRRVLGPLQLTAVGIGAIIGSGIFVMPGVVAHDKAGPALILSFAVAALACAFAALCYAELASMMPVAGSAYIYANAALGEVLAELVNIGTLFAFVIVCAAVLVMRRTHPEEKRPFRVPFVPLTPILGILTCLILMFSLPAMNWLRLGIWFAVGLVIYLLYGWRHSRLSGNNTTSTGFR